MVHASQFKNLLYRRLGIDQPEGDSTVVALIIGGFVQRHECAEAATIHQAGL